MTRIAIIGGGAAGSAVVGEFLRRADRAGIELVWLAGRGVPGRGVAYATQNDQHLLNVRAANMGLFADDAGALMRFLAERQSTARPSDFIPRALFGEYVESTLLELLSAARNISVEIRSAEAVGLDERASGGYVVRSDEGEELRVDGAVLAIGALPPVPMAAVDARSLAGGCYLRDPWQRPQLERAPERMVVLGSGLTAIDVILSAAEAWPSARIVTLSRHGRLPGVHRAEPGAPYPHQGELIEEMRARPDVRRWMRLVREAVQLDRADWRAVVDGLRPATVELWRSLDLRQRRRFLRHVRWVWEVARHRMPCQTSLAIRQLMKQGRLTVLAGRVRRVEGLSPLTVTYRQRSTGTTRVVTTDIAIQATGLQTAVQRTSHLLLRQLFQSGLVKADPLGLGVEADVDGRPLRGDGTAAPGLRVIGTLLRGSLWECTAVPEIRTIAANLVRELLNELRPGSEPGHLARRATYAADAKDRYAAFPPAPG